MWNGGCARAWLLGAATAAIVCVSDRQDVVLFIVIMKIYTFSQSVGQLVSTSGLFSGLDCNYMGNPRFHFHGSGFGFRSRFRYFHAHYF